MPSVVGTATGMVHIPPFAMRLVDYLFAVRSVRPVMVRLWYRFLTRRLRGEEVLFLNYGFETEPPLGLPLSPADEPDRACIQLYHQVATQVDLRSRRVLEVSCGHGGGASYLTRTLRPAAFTGLDRNPAGIRFCQKRHRVDGLTFVPGDAGQLPFADGTFDAVINIEASHCYPEFPRFLAEVTRVLRPGGHFLYADYRYNEEVTAWEQTLAAASLTLLRSRVINAEVLRGMDRNAPRALGLIARHLPRFMHRIGRDFAGVPGSHIYNAVLRADLSYRSYCLQKPA
ncbi:MAG TPA: class I SAM-dependent methyltransferase [Opitutaceae bacterium]|nr:class I SAM-dependent methyltransferase [Opitutaceae bacterium]